MSDTPGEKIESLYHELLFAVASKYVGETRHETALRYIQQAEGGMVSKDELRPILEELKAAWQSVEHIDFSDHMHKAQDKLESLLGDTAKEAP